MVFASIGYHDWEIWVFVEYLLNPTVIDALLARNTSAPPGPWIISIIVVIAKVLRPGNEFRGFIGSGGVCRGWGGGTLKSF